MNAFDYAPASILSNQQLASELSRHVRGLEGWSFSEGQYTNLGWSQFEKDCNQGLSGGAFTRTSPSELEDSMKEANQYVDVGALSAKGQAHYLYDQVSTRQYDEAYTDHRLEEVRAVLNERYVEEELWADPSYREDMAAQLEELPESDHTALISAHMNAENAMDVQGEAEMTDFVAMMQSADQEKTEGLSLAR